MSLVAEIKRRLRSVFLQIAAAGTVFYFGYHALEGDRGILAYLRLQEDVTQIRAKAEGLQARRATLEHRVALLRPQSLDPDLLEERARLLLDFAAAEDLVIFYSDFGVNQ